MTVVDKKPNHMKHQLETTVKHCGAIVSDPVLLLDEATTSSHIESQATPYSYMSWIFAEILHADQGVPIAV